MDEGTIKIKNELTYARNLTRKACQAAKTTTRTAHMSKMYINSVDDEIHFLITCSYFATQRTSLLAESKLLNSEFDSLSNDDKFIYIMSSTHRPLVICLAKYTYSCFQTLSVSGTSTL